MEFTLKTDLQRSYDVVVVGGGTAGVMAAIASARTGAKTAIVESKGYVGGTITEGGCGIHSFFNVWKAFEGVEKRKVVRGIPSEFIDRLTELGGASGHNEVLKGYDYDSDALFVDVEKYKYLALVMLEEAGVDILVNTTLVDTITKDAVIQKIITVSHQGTEIISAKMFIDSTGYGDLAARSGAEFTEPNDHTVANTVGIAGIDIDEYYKKFAEKDCIKEYARGKRSGKDNQIIRVDVNWNKYDPKLWDEMREMGLQGVVTTMYDNYFMFMKVNTKMPKSPTDRDCLAETEVELRKRQMNAIEFVKKHIPKSENAFITRSCPSMLIRRARCIVCEHDISNDEICNATHFEDDIFSYSFHDCAPRFIVKDGGTYGFPYRAILPKNNKNLFTIGMMITSDWNAHMSTRNTVSCMAQGQGAGTAAALCAIKNITNTRNLPYQTLRAKLESDNVYFG
ncbi:MAG: FAD-dependent oxidoreductase [Clostridia bacterium]